MISAIHGRLRAATQAEHQRLEDRVRIVERIGVAESRRPLVAQFHRLHAEIEAAVSPWLAELVGLDFAARRRTPRLAADLADLGLPTSTPRPGAIEARSTPEALGLMYVVEGSTLGGRVIRREAALRGVDMFGLSFLDPYGDRVGERWKSFLAVLEGAVQAPADTDAMVTGARAGFQHAELRLCAEPVNV
jgi:heme oxygenase